MVEAQNATTEERRLYMPGSGSEGMDFESVFCDNCVHNNRLIDRGTGEEVGCPINDYAHLSGEGPNQWVYGETGPECVMYREDDARKSALRERELYSKAMRGE